MSKPQHGRFISLGQGHRATLARNPCPHVREPEQTERGRVVDVALRGDEILVTLARPRHTVLP